MLRIPVLAFLVLVAPLGGCQDEPAPPPASPPAAEVATSTVTVPGSRVSLRLPSPVDRVDRAFILEATGERTIHVRVAETNLGSSPREGLGAALAEQAGVGPGTKLVEDPPNSGRWRTQPESPHQIRLRHLRRDKAAAAVLVGVESHADLELADEILSSATIDPQADYDPSQLLGVSLDQPAKMSPVDALGPVLMFESDAPRVDGGMTIAWIHAGVPIDDAFLKSTLVDALQAQLGTDETPRKSIEFGGLPGWEARGETPREHFYVGVFSAPGETSGLFMVHASARGEEASALIDSALVSLRSLRVQPRPGVTSSP